MKENFPNMAKEIDFRKFRKLRESQRSWTQGSTHHIIIKLPKIKDKERILKAAEEKETVPTKEFPSYYQLISEKKPCRQEGAGKKYSKS